MTSKNKYTKAPVYIAGLGIISAIGNNVTECLEALEHERPGMGAIETLDTLHRQQFPVAGVKAGNKELAASLGVSPEVSRTALLSLIAAKEALASSGLEGRSSWRIGMVSANTVGGMDKTEHFFKSFLEDPKKGRLKEVVHH